jgi:hypothetical protein
LDPASDAGAPDPRLKSNLIGIFAKISTITYMADHNRTGFAQTLSGF